MLWISRPLPFDPACAKAPAGKIAQGSLEFSECSEKDLPVAALGTTYLLQTHQHRKKLEWGELPLGGQSGSESLSKSRPVASTEILGFGGHYCTSFCLFLGYSEFFAQTRASPGMHPRLCACRCSREKRSDANLIALCSYSVF